MQLRHSPDLQRLLSAARHVEAVSWAAGYVDNNRRIHKVVYIIGVTLLLLRLCGRYLVHWRVPFLMPTFGRGNYCIGLSSLLDFDPLGLPQRVVALVSGVEPLFPVRSRRINQRYITTFVFDTRIFRSFYV